MKKKQKILKLGPGLSALGDNNKHVIQAPGGEEKQGGKSIWINHDQIFPKFGKKKKNYSSTNSAQDKFRENLPKDITVQALGFKGADESRQHRGGHTTAGSAGRQAGQSEGREENPDSKPAKRSFKVERKWAQFRETPTGRICHQQAKNANGVFHAEENWYQMESQIYTQGRKHNRNDEYWVNILKIWFPFF